NSKIVLRVLSNVGTEDEDCSYVVVDLKTDTLSIQHDKKKILDDHLINWDKIPSLVFAKYDEAKYHPKCFETVSAAFGASSIKVKDPKGSGKLALSSTIMHQQSPDNGKWTWYQYQHQPKALKTLALESLMKSDHWTLEKSEEEMKEMGIPKAVP
ncbi:MAG: hypothetical protein GY696_38860, partial [Gammaproteobacteria bacterium]|nr:hypothetical protein [Gammaproteobacteria bacterium]